MSGVVSGNNVEILIDGKTVGLAQTVNGSEDYSPEPASGIGSMYVQEWVPTMARYTVRVSSMAMGAGAGAAVIGGGQNVDIVIASKEGGGRLAKFSDCSFAQGDINVQKHQIVINNATFYALDKN